MQVSVTRLQKEQGVWERAVVPFTMRMWSLERNEAGWRLGRTLELYSQDQPIATIFAKSGQAPPQVCVLETLSCASEDEPEVWPGVCMHSKHASQWPWKGPPGTVVTAL